MVAPLGLLEPVQVLLERLLGLPGGAVDALELLVLLVAAPVRRGRAHQLEGRDPLGGRQVRAAAQVLPGHLAVAVEVVVDGQLAGADLGARRPRRHPARRTPFRPISSSLYGSSASSSRASSSETGAAREALVLLDDLAHPGLDLLEVLGHERRSRRRSRSRSRSRSAGRCRASRRGTAPARPGPSRARSSGAGCRGRRRLSMATASTSSPSASSWARSRSVAADPGGDHLGVVGEQLPGLGAGVTVWSSRASAWMRATLMSDTRLAP